jgi:outer membrane lipoprotein-sorting protein
MKKFLFSIALSTLVGLTSTRAQDARAAAILDAMSKKYKALSSFSANFTYSAEGGGTQRYKGDVTAKGGKFRLKLAGQEIYNDGKTVATYVKETNEVNLSDYEPGDNELNPAKIYTIYKKGYTNQFIGETKEGGQTYEIVELTPEEKNAQVKSVRITVNKADKSVRSWRITDKSGKTQTFQVDKFTPNVAVTDQFFAFDKTKYPGVEVVDLR